MKKKLIVSLLSTFASALLMFSLSGCAWSIGDGKGHANIHQATKGQELVDLKKAKDQGAINDEEYENQRKQILNR
jgi:hypothetical protein